MKFLLNIPGLAVVQGRGPRGRFFRSHPRVFWRAAARKEIAPGRFRGRPQNSNWHPEINASPEKYLFLKELLKDFNKNKLAKELFGGSQTLKKFVKTCTKKSLNYLLKKS